MKSIGGLGGTFDPIHNGHLTVADEVMHRLGLDEVVFVPAGHPWLNKTGPVSAAEHRVEMVRLAIANKPRFSISNLEIDELPSNTVDTITELSAELPPEDELLLIISWDTLATLSKWWESWRLINLCRLVAVPRPGSSSPDLRLLDKIIPGLSRRVILLDKPLINISATEIRQMVARGQDISQLVPEAVARYIKEQGLYRVGDGG